MVMNASPTVKYFSQHHKRCRKYLLAYNLTHTNDYLHHNRVAIKKIKAVLGMLSAINEDFDFNKAYKPYKNIFKHLAPIREYMLQTERLKNHTGKKNIAGKQPPNAALLNKELKKATSEYLKEMEEGKPFILKEIGQLDPKAIYPYCHKLIKQTKRKCKHHGKVSHLHENRKQLKQVLYCIKLLNTKERSKLLSAKTIAVINKLQDDIGQWHDNLELMERIKKEKINTGKEFNRSLENETDDLLKRIHKNNQEWVSG